MFWRRWKKISKLRVTGLCEGNSPMTGEFPAQRASNAENVSIWWHHHDVSWPYYCCTISPNLFTTLGSLGRRHFTMPWIPVCHWYYLHICYSIECQRPDIRLCAWGNTTPTSLGIKRSFVLILILKIHFKEQRNSLFTSRTAFGHTCIYNCHTMYIIKLEVRNLFSWPSSVYEI